MNLIFNSIEYTLRMEYFGGLLINKESMEKYELSKYDLIWLNGLKEGNSFSQIQDYFYKEFNIVFKPNVDFYIKKNVLIKGEKEITHPSKTMEEILKEYEIQKEKKYLRAPIELTIYPTHSCQLKCEFCFFKSKRNKKEREITAEKWIEIINDFVKEGTVSVLILGGEPSCYYDIVNLLKGMEEMKIRTAITTNGQSWSQELFEVVASSKYITPIVSIESLRKNEAMKQGLMPDCYKSISLIKKFKEKGKNCRINTVYLGQNDDELKEIIDLAVENELDKCSIALCMDEGENLDAIKDIIALKRRLNEYVRNKYGRIKFNLTFEGCMLYSACKTLDGSIVNTEYQCKQYGCECGNTIMEILSNGDAYSCAAYMSKGTKLGNIINKNWKEIWNKSQELKRLRERQSSDIVCRDCSMFHFCKGGCPAYIEEMGGKIDSSYDLRCEIHKNLEKINA